MSEHDIRFRSDVDVELVRHSAADSDVVFAARVSTQGARTLDHVGDDATEAAGLIKFLMKNRHGTPFEHNSMTFFVSAPIFVFRELMRHRIASYNEESGRYKELAPVFYTPAVERNLVQVGKAGAYEFTSGDTDQYHLVDNSIRKASATAYAAYQKMLSKGIAREVARMVLPVNIYSSAYVTVNARGLMNILSLRTKSDKAAYPSYPQHEIQLVAEGMERDWAGLMPLTHAAFDSCGRVTP
ncbi:MAG: FAD-dependent thymidylate synthase [Spirochaetes bacterium]|nr:MAG: FAD-dependent thymidylate synthase [Spirochaetota bacterium]